VELLLRCVALGVEPCLTVVVCHLEKCGIRRRNNIIIHRYSKYCDADIFHHSASQTQLLDVDGKELLIVGPYIRVKHEIDDENVRSQSNILDLHYMILDCRYLSSLR